MKCQDVRRTLPLFVDGQLALTEWAIIQGHLPECAECRKEVDRLRAVAGMRARATHLHATVMTRAADAGDPGGGRPGRGPPLSGGGPPPPPPGTPPPPPGPPAP